MVPPLGSEASGTTAAESVPLCAAATTCSIPEPAFGGRGLLDRAEPLARLHPGDAGGRAAVANPGTTFSSCPYGQVFALLGALDSLVGSRGEGLMLEFDWSMS